MNRKLIALASAALLLSPPAFAQTQKVPQYLNSAGLKVPAQGVVCIDPITQNPASCGGTSAGVTAHANATAQAATEGDASAYLSVDLLHQLRVLLGDVSGSPLSFADVRAVDTNLNVGTLNNHLDVPINGGFACVGFAISGLTGTGATVVIQSTTADTATTPQWSPVTFYVNATTLASSITTDGNYQFRVSGKSAFRVNVGTAGTNTNTKVSYSVSTGCTHAILDGALPPGTNDIGYVHDQPSLTNTLTTFHVISAASDNHANIKPTSGTAYSVDASNQGTGWMYVRLYNAGAGFNGCNSATNLIWGQAVAPGGGFIKEFKYGRFFSTGLSICVSGGTTDTDTTAANTLTTVNVGYF